jgi:hypothetical protein
MSSSHSHGAKVSGGGGPDNLHDMNLGKIVIVGLVSLTLFAAGVVWAYQLMVRREADILATTGVAATPTELGKVEIGIVDQVPFEIDHRVEKWRADHKKALASYGWVDRAKGIARIPIEQAMERVVASPPDIPGEGVAPRAAPPMPAPVGAAEKGKAPRDQRDHKESKDIKAGADTKDNKGGTAK